MNPPTRPRLLSRAVLIVLMGCAVGPALAASAEELEARIARLEKQLAELSAALKAQTPVAQTPAPGAPPPAPIQTTSVVPNALAGTKFLLSGFIKADANFTRTSQGEIPDSTVGRDFFVPATIPIGAADEGVDVDTHIKQTRLIFGTDTVTESGAKYGSRVELDFFGSITGDQRSTNTYAPVIRHAYLTYNNWLVGQTWSNFQDLDAMPDSVDLIGPTDGTVFVRQPQVRYSSGNWVLSLENPETTLTPFRGGARIASDDNFLPDVVLRYTWKPAWGYLSVAGIGRQLVYETATTDDFATAFAASFSGKLLLGDDDLRFALTAGQGIGRYVGLNFNNDAALDAQGDMEVIEGTAGFLAYRHVFNPSWRSNLIASGSRYNNNIRLTGVAANKSSRSFAANLIHTPAAKLDLGFEFRYAKRALESGAQGSFYRFQAMAKYAF